MPDLGISTVDNRISDVQQLLWLADKDLLKDDVVAALLNYTNAG